ncbi:hypothetical protein C5N14_18695 [Micromonospora sp. MW-13]|uniref:hypothetical protein n=1 Tax=Micromonospora sp. MW-13 TaxID=2094022 RepID=UPI000E437860|nr:hypothetical protein [Micromonospora sp. MW-13]RGC67383.1 hypothetical protein C5N14_18695 [Micromonospora sp. MW-13]
MESATRLGAALAVAVAAVAGPLAGAARAADAPVAAPASERAAGVPVVAPASEPSAGPPGGGQPDRGQPGWLVFVEVSPGTVQPGYLVGIRASCHDNSVPAIVVSDAFGRVAARPDSGLLTASPMVRERTWPGNYPVKLECRGGETASTMLQVVKRTPSHPPSPTHRPTHEPVRHPTHPAAQHPSRGPNTGFGGTAGAATGGLLLPGGVALAVAGVTIGVVTRRRPRVRRGTAGR